MPYRKTDKTRRRNERRRRQIMNAARRLFSRQGYEITTMNQIVDKAKTSIGNLYFYFDNKQSLLLAIVKDTVDTIWLDTDEDEYLSLSGTAKLALITYRFATMLMEKDQRARILDVGNSVPIVRKAMFEDFHRRVLAAVENDSSILTGIDTDLKFYASYGAITAILDRKRSGEVIENPHEIGMFLAQWNLQAIGVGPETADEALAAVEKFAARKRTEKSRAANDE